MDSRTNRNVWEIEYIFQNLRLLFPKEYQISYRYIRQKLWQSSLHYSGLKKSNLIGLQYAQIHWLSKYTVNDICQRRLNERSLSQFLRMHRGGINVQFCWVPQGFFICHIISYTGCTWGCNRECIFSQIGKRGFVKRNISSNSPWEGERKVIVKRKGIEIWQKWWEEDKKGRQYCQIQKSVSIKNHKERNRLEDILMTILRVDHTGLYSTLFLVGKRNNDNCVVKENAEHVIFDYSIRGGKTGVAK